MSARVRRTLSESTATSLVSELINRAIDSTVDTNSAKLLAAERVLDLSPEAQHAILQKAIKQMVAKRIRATTRRAIRNAEADALDKDGKQIDPSQSHPIEWSDELLAREFALPDGTYVTWGEATADQHRQRVAMYQTLENAASDGRRRHFQAAREIGKRHARNLYEVSRDIDQERNDRA